MVHMWWKATKVGWYRLVLVLHHGHVCRRRGCGCCPIGDSSATNTIVTVLFLLSHPLPVHGDAGQQVFQLIREIILVFLLQKLIRYSLHSNHVKIQMIAILLGVGHLCHSHLVHRGHVGHHTAHARQPTWTVRAFEVFCFLVIQQHFQIIKLPVAVVTKWFKYFLLPSSLSLSHCKL